MPDIGVPPASALPVYRTLKLPQKRQQILGPDLNCSESKGALPTLPVLPPTIAHTSLLHCRISTLPLSALGHKLTESYDGALSALHPKADIANLPRYVRFVPFGGSRAIRRPINQL
jgi:hypothetical protein